MALLCGSPMFLSDAPFQVFSFIFPRFLVPALRGRLLPAALQLREPSVWGPQPCQTHTFWRQARCFPCTCWAALAPVPHELKSKAAFSVHVQVSLMSFHRKKVKSVEQRGVKGSESVYLPEFILFLSLLSGASWLCSQSLGFSLFTKASSASDVRVSQKALFQVLSEGQYLADVFK